MPNFLKDIRIDRACIAIGAVLLAVGVVVWLIL